MIPKYTQNFRKVISYLTGVELEEVPNFSINGNSAPQFYREIDKFLINKFGYALFRVPISSNRSLQDLLYDLQLSNSDNYYILSGMDANDKTHIVVCCGGKIVFNPDPSMEIVRGLYSGWWVMCLTTGYWIVGRDKKDKS